MTSLIFIHLGLLGEKAKKKVLAFYIFSDFPKGGGPKSPNTAESLCSASLRRAGRLRRCCVCLREEDGAAQLVSVIT